MNNNNFRGTRSLYLAAAFIALGAEYLETEKSDIHNMEFRFSLTKTVPKVEFESQALNSAVPTKMSSVTVNVLPFDTWEMEWVNETLLVNAVKYADALRKLKSVIHSR